MFYVPWGLMKRFSGVVLIAISLPATDLKCLIKNLIFNSIRFKETAFKQCSPLLAIPVIWNHLDREAHHQYRSQKFYSFTIH